MTIQNDTLIIINSKKRIQKIYLSLNKDENQEIYYIERYSGQYGGKETAQPIHTIEKGKVKRTVLEQATLEYNSILKKYLDKGYNKLSSLTNKEYSELSEEELKSLLGGTTTDQSGIPKPMLAKIAGDCKADIWNRQWYISRKIDGVRALFYYKDGEIKTASRGGGEYNVATTHLRTDPYLLEIFRLRPDLILDGEIYHHGTDWPLQRISGLARLKEWKDECNELEYWVYDIVSSDSFTNRYSTLKVLEGMLPKNYKIKILEQKLMTGYDAIKAEHDKYVQEGFEGLCARNPDKEYGIGKRSGEYLIKLKEYKDDEFEVTGIKTGLRDEDMCFTLKTIDGKEFAAKPVGTVETRLYYLEHWSEYVGKKATCKYFYYSEEGTPIQPILLHFRPDDE